MATPFDPNTLSQVIELLNQAKPLFTSDNALALSIIGALSAIGGALATFFPGYWLARRHELQLKRSVVAQLYAEIKATLLLEQHRGYIQDLCAIIEQFDRGDISACSYQIKVANDRFPIFKENLKHLGKLEPQLQQKIVLLYQLIEAGIQDMQPGGLLNERQVGRKPFVELHEILIEARHIAEDVLAQIEADYPRNC